MNSEVCQHILTASDLVEYLQPIGNYHPFYFHEHIVSRFWQIKAKNPLEIVGEILQPDLGSSLDQPNRPNQFAVHRHHLVVKYMFDTSPAPNPRQLFCCWRIARGF